MLWLSLILMQSNSSVKLQQIGMQFLRAQPATLSFKLRLQIIYGTSQLETNTSNTGMA